jgi:hypothetical protein
VDSLSDSRVHRRELVRRPPATGVPAVLTPETAAEITR